LTVRRGEGFHQTGSEEKGNWYHGKRKKKRKGRSAKDWDRESAMIRGGTGKKSSNAKTQGEVTSPNNL